MGEQYPKRVVCRVLGIAPSSHYYQPQPVEESELCMAIQAVCADFPRYGYRRVTAELHRRGQPANRKRVARLLKSMGLQAKKVVRKRKTTNSQHSFPRFPNLVADLVAERPDQIWVADITYIRLGTGFVYLAVIMDVYTRAIRGWYLSRSLDRFLTLNALQQAFQRHRPEIHHSDQGIQYACPDYTDLLQAREVQISMAEVGEPTQNGFAERLMRTIKEEEVDLSDYADYHEAYQQIGRFLEDVYMRKRVHSSLNYLTPAEFESQWHRALDVVSELPV
jgi:transposase InsO family protein